MKKKLNILNYIISILIIAIVAFSYIHKFFENDLFFDIKTGETILKYGLDFKDHFSFIPELKYVYLHWFYDILIFYIYKFSNWNGIFIFFTTIFTIFGMTVFFVNLKKTNKLIATITSLFTIYLSAYAFQSRVQSITNLLIFLEVYWLEQLYTKGQKKYLIYLILSSILVVNIHMPLWIFFIILYLPYLAETLLYVLSYKIPFLNKLELLQPPKNNKLIIISFLFLLLTGLCSPLFFYPYIFFTKSLFNNIYSFIGEMHTTALFGVKWELLLIIIMIIGSYLKIIKFKTRDLFIVLGLFVFSLIVIKNIAYFFIIVPTILIKNCSLRNKLECQKFNSYVKKVNIKAIQIFTVISLIGIYLFINYKFYSENKDYNISDDYPDKTVKYIKKHFDYDNLKIYTDYGYGSYIAFYNIPIFVDSRAEVYIKKFNRKSDILKDYLKLSDFHTYKKVLNKYQFNLAIVKEKSDLYYFLKQDKDYKIIFKEKEINTYILFEKQLSK